MRTQRRPVKKSALDVLFHHTVGQVGRYRSSKLHPYNNLLTLIKSSEKEFSELSEEQFDRVVGELKLQLRKEGITESLLAKTFACARNAAGRSVGMYHFDSQLLGGLAIFYGNIAEMQTGEGKTLTAILPAAAAALAGVPVHVITVNDYLAARDAEEMEAVYQRLGLTVGYVVAGMEMAERQQAYSCDVVYCTNNELVFDYLKDSLIIKDANNSLRRHSARMQGKNNIAGQLMLRGLHFAVIDEADSVLLDEARTPLVISGEVGGNSRQIQIYGEAMVIARELEKDEHFQLDVTKREVTFLEEGEKLIEQSCSNLGSYWIGRTKRLEMLHKALMALYIFKANVDYLIVDGKVQIIDENTGRVMPDRSWEAGLHQMIETKEECELTSPRETLARISYQKFFRFYHHIGGMTGTAKEVTGELWSTYGLPVVKIPTHRPSLRQDFGSRLYFTREQQWEALLKQIVKLHAEKRSVLVGTANVEASEALSVALDKENIPHQVLNAKNNEQEADMVSQAGQVGQITVATSMAGRGTDIKLCEEVREHGGLHVLLTQYLDASRIDRQLIGRSARLGDPGSFEMILALSDASASTLWSRLLITLLNKFQTNEKLQNWQRQLGLWLLKHEQKQLENHHAYSRRLLLKSDERQGEILAFVSG